MFVVVFEVEPHRDRWNEYLTLAGELRPRLEAIDGFIDNERFVGTRRASRLLSLSTWRDEKALVRWRTDIEHHRAQRKGRGAVFADYRLRVGEVTADSHPPLPVEEQRFDATEIGPAKALGITAITAAQPDAVAELLGLDPRADGVVDHATFESINQKGRFLLLVSFLDAEASGRFDPGASPTGASIRHRRVRVIRDYGMTERREAPQAWGT